MLYGPPGCSKTTLAKAVANSSGVSFFTLSGAVVYSAYVGESERICMHNLLTLVRDLFTKARRAAPSIIFLDEIDAMVGKRALGKEGGETVQERILSTLLNEMDGVGSVGDVTVVVSYLND